METKPLFAGLLLCLNLFNLNAFSQNISLWNGETPNIGNCQFGDGMPTNTQVHSGAWAFEGKLTKFNSCSINLQCQDTWRIDISTYNEIQFYIRTNTPGINVQFYITGWPYTSNTVDIEPYVINGPINGNYKLVKIPISVLQNADYDLNSIENLRFKGSNLPDGQDVFIDIDDISVIDNQPNKVDSLQLLSSQVVRLDMSGRYDMNSVTNLSNYQLSSADDPDFAQNTAPTKLGRHFFVRSFPENSTNPRIKNELFLYFSKAMKNGKHYTLTVNNVKDLSGNNFSSPQQLSINFNDTGLINHSVKVNQVGYFNWGPKYAYIGNYLGDAGAMPLFPTSFQLKSAINNQVVLNGIPDFRGNDLSLSGEKIFECDFSSFNTPGEYYIYVPGVGRSYNFEISTEVMDSVYYKTARSLFYQRCGMALNPPFADPKYVHAACHLNDGYPHNSWLNSPLYNGENMNIKYPTTLGWHDAGDYGKYTSTASSALYYMFTIYELFPLKFADKELNLPESGNGVPDILDEARHEILWLMNMQAADGGVFDRVTTLDWPTTMPENDLGTRYIAEKTTPNTGQFAAIMAMAYRNFLPYWPALANQCLTKAKLAMNFMLAHPNMLPANGYHPKDAGMGGGDYWDVEGDQDERAWAAAELYKSTGEINYRNLFDTYWAQHPPYWGWNQFQHHQIPASIAYATTKFPVDANKVNQFKSAMLDEVNSKIITRTDNNYYRSGCNTAVVDYIGWGAYGQSSKYSWDLIMAYYFSGDEKYRKYALLNLDVQLGNNPQDKTYITGVGTNSPQHPLHHPSLTDGVDAPVPGIPVFGPNSHLALVNPFNIAVQAPENLYPLGASEDDPYPVLRRYYDISSNVAMSEFNIIDEAITSSVYAFFKPKPLSMVNQPKLDTKLSYFKAEKEDEKVRLSWETNPEFELNYFGIERSKNGIDFFELQKIYSMGDNNLAQPYQQYDLSPLPYTSYYRLKLVDKKGNVLYSEVQKVFFSESKIRNLVLYPNPVFDQITMSLNDDNNADVIEIWDMLVSDFEGKMVLMTQGELASLSAILNQKLSRMLSGVYFIQLKKDKEEFKAKFIKK